MNYLNFVKNSILFNLLIINNLSVYAQKLTTSREIPENMVFVDGGRVKIGSAEGLDNEKPIFNTDIHPFYLDQNPVTVGQFRLFVKINRYITDAEKKGEGAIFDKKTGQWQLIKGADWQFPLGRDKLQANNQEPVRQISWNDAKAYANWLGKRLPNEFELEYAARNAEKLQLHSIGSLWQWCENWYVRYDESSYYKKNRLNQEKVLRCGNYTATPTGEVSKFRPSIRTSALPQTVSYSFGFRCAKDIK